MLFNKTQTISHLSFFNRIPTTKYHQIQSYPISFFNTSHDHSFCSHNNNITHITSQNTIKTTNHNLMIIPLHHPISSFSNSSQFPFHIFKHTTITSIISWIDWRIVCEKRIHSFLWMWCSSTSINTPNWLKCLTLLMMCVLNLSYLSTHHSLIYLFIHSVEWVSFHQNIIHLIDCEWMDVRNGDCKYNMFVHFNSMCFPIFVFLIFKSVFSFKYHSHLSWMSHNHIVIITLQIKPQWTETQHKMNVKPPNPLQTLPKSNIHIFVMIGEQWLIEVFWLLEEFESNTCVKTHTSLHIDDEYDDLCFLINSPFVLLYEWVFDECVKWERVKCWKWLRGNTKCDWENQDVFWWEWYLEWCFERDMNTPHNPSHWLKWFMKMSFSDLKCLKTHKILLKFDWWKTKNPWRERFQNSHPQKWPVFLKDVNHSTYFPNSLSVFVSLNLQYYYHFIHHK